MTPGPTTGLVDLLASDPQVAAAVDRAREACGRLRWHQALRRRTAEVRAESIVRGARASAALDGVRLTEDVYRDALRGTRPLPHYAAGDAAAGALRVTALATDLGLGPATPGFGVLARLHLAAVADGAVPGLDREQWGRPRTGQERPLDLVALPAAPRGEDLGAVLARLREVLAAPATVPGLIVASVASGLILATRPFVAGNGVVSRAVLRMLAVHRGLDPTGTSVPEAGIAEDPVAHASHAGALARALTSPEAGEPEAWRAWTVFCADAVVRGATAGEGAADAVLRGRP